MLARRSKRLIQFICLVGALSFSGMVYTQELTAEREKTDETPEQKIERLEKEILELRDGMAMLMENLGGCTEENEELQSKTETLEDAYDSSDSGAYEEKVILIDRLRAMLNTGEDMNFLLRLREKDLRTLLQVVQGCSGKLK